MPTRLSGVVPWFWDDLEKETAERENRPVRLEPHFPPYEIFIRYLLSFQGLVDLISVIPTYIYLANARLSTTSTTILRILRLLRVIRTIRINTHGRMVVDLLARTAHSSREAMFILGFYFMLLVIFFASVIYAVENGEFTVNEHYPTGKFLRPDGYGGKAESPFDSIPTSIYYMIVTMTSVGYGDLSPTSITGRAIASICCLLGLFLTALPISIISTNFSEEYKKFLIKREKYDKYQRNKRDIAQTLRGIPLTSRLRAAMRRLRQRRHDEHDELSSDDYHHHHKHSIASKTDFRAELLHSKSIQHLSFDVLSQSEHMEKMTSRLSHRHSRIAVDLIKACVEAKKKQVDELEMLAQNNNKAYEENTVPERKPSRVSLMPVAEVDESQVEVEITIDLKPSAVKGLELTPSTPKPTPKPSPATSIRKRVYADVNHKLGYDVIRQTSSSEDDGISSSLAEERDSITSSDIVTMNDLIKMQESVLSSLPKEVLKELFFELKVGYEELLSSFTNLNDYAMQVKGLSNRTRSSIVDDGTLQRKVLHALHEEKMYDNRFP
jgi:hypothetical protein